MEDFFQVKCPGCDTILVIDRRECKIVEVRKPILEESTGDRFEDAMLKVKGEKDAIAKKVEQAKTREKDKIKRLNALFEEGLERAKDEGPVTKPFNPMDLD